MTPPLRNLLAASAVFAGLAVAPGNAFAAESYGNCTGFVDSLPAGDDSNTNGITAVYKQNATVRHCNVRGFDLGLNFYYGAGHLVEDNRFDNNLSRGISVRQVSNSVVQRNRVYDTGGRPGSTRSWGIQASGDVIDNVVAGVFADGANADPIAILVERPSMARNNRVRGVQVSGTGVATGIKVTRAGSMVDGNHVIGGTTANIPGAAIAGSGSPVTPDIVCSNNVTAGFYNSIHACINAGGNSHVSF